MALTAYGFNGTIDDIAWARLARHMGTHYGVGQANDFRVETVVGQDRTVRVLPSASYVGGGGAFGHGVLVTADVNSTVQLPLITTGTRWDLIVLRRNWNTKAVSITSVQGGASIATALSARNKVVGDIDDQPLAAVQVTAGSTLPTSIVDYRLFTSEVIYAQTLTAVVDPRPGMEAVVGGARYRWEPDNGGTFGWRSSLSSAARTVRTTGQADGEDQVASGAMRPIVTYTGVQPPGEYLVTFQVNYANASVGEATATARVPGMQDTRFEPNHRRNNYVFTGLLFHPGGTLTAQCSIQPTVLGRVWATGTHVIVSRAG